MKFQTTGHFLFLLGISLWLGSLVFLGYGVAPVNFSTAADWELQGVNPDYPDKIQNVRNIGGELTARSIAKLNQIEIFAIFLCTIGITLFWYPRFNRPSFLTSQTVIMALMVGIFMIYGIAISAELNEIRNNYPLDFSISNYEEKSFERLRFDNLHAWYSRLATVNIVLAVVQLILASAQYHGIRYGTKE